MTQPKEDALEHLMLEEELDLQVSLLKEHTPDSTLFPDDEAELKAMPHLKDDASSKQHEKEHEGLFHKPTPYEIYELEETVLEENLMEPVLVRSTLRKNCSSKLEKKSLLGSTTPFLLFHLFAESIFHSKLFKHNLTSTIFFPVFSPSLLIRRFAWRLQPLPSRLSSS